MTVSHRHQRMPDRSGPFRGVHRHRGWGCALLAAGLLLSSGPSASTQNPAPGQRSVGYRIRVNLPLTGSSDQVLKQMVQRVVEQQPPGPERGVVVLEFWPPAGNEGSGSEFERALSLARFLTSTQMERVRTVAYIPRAAVGHAVLVALACEEIIMQPDAILGDAGIDEKAIGPTIRGGYMEIARSRRTVPEAIALGMLDPQLQVYRITTGSGTLYAWDEELEKLKQQRQDIRAVDTLIPTGKMGRFRGDELRQLGFVSYLASNREELAAALKIPADELEFDPSLGGNWRPIRVDLTGVVTAQSVDRAMRTIQQQLDARDANFICVQIDSAGGSPRDSVRLANFLADLDQSRVRTVAYIPEQARGDAIIVALACDHTVVHPNAVLGGSGAATIDQTLATDLRGPIRQIAQRKSRDWSLVAAMFDPQLQVHAYRRARNGRRDLSLARGVRRTIRARPQAEVPQAEVPQAEVPQAEVPQAAEWTQGPAVTQPGRVLELDGQTAKQLGLAHYLAEDLGQLQQLYQLEQTPELIGPNWAFELVDALASPQLASLLLFIGTFALIAELSSPGIGIGGFISALCFLLYFWSNFLHGTAELLEVLLFLAGISFLAIEMFVLPGFGIFGLGGGMLIIASLVLASQTFVLPTNEYQMRQLPRSLLTVAAAVGGVVTSLYVLRRYLHSAPVVGNVMLMPPDEDEAEVRARREALVDYGHLIGREGTTRTQLTPSGKAMFGDELLDVITDGIVVPRGSRIRVVEVTGNRVLVEPLDENP